MLTVAYRFHVLPRHHDHIRHSWHAAEDTLQKVIGLQRGQLRPPQDRRQPFTLVLSWDNEASFNRFTRTWAGVWAINGMGLEQSDFFAPTQTSMFTEPNIHLQQQAA